MFFIWSGAVFIDLIILDHEEDRHRSDGEPHQDLSDYVQVARFGYLLDPPFIEGGIFTPC